LFFLFDERYSISLRLNAVIITEYTFSVPAVDDFLHPVAEGRCPAVVAFFPVLQHPVAGAGEGLGYFFREPFFLIHPE
jgi:hypothetical protein